MTSRAAAFFARAGVALLASFLAAALGAQVPSAVLSGTVTDPAGKAVPNARISAKNAATEQTTETETDSAGRYEGLSLAPGDYEVSVAAPGFSTTITKLTITASGRQTVNLSLRGLISLEDIGFLEEARGSAAGCWPRPPTSGGSSPSRPGKFPNRCASQAKRSAKAVRPASPSPPSRSSWRGLRIAGTQGLVDRELQ